MIPRFPAYIFDVDGTLVDSALDITGAIQEVLVSHGKHDASFEYLRSFIGRHLIDLFVEVFPGIADDKVEELIKEYRAIYLAREHRMTSVYPGVLEGLEVLPGLKSTATTKGSPTTRAVLEQFGLLPHFQHVQGTDGFPAKPAPDVLFKAIEGLGVRLEDCLFVGDAPADLEAGKRAGVRTCAVTYGYGPPEEMARWEPDYWVRDLRELSA